MKEKRGRKKLDLAYRVRTWFWYALVKDKLQQSDDKLDELYATANKFQRARVFWNYRRVGYSPDVRRGSRARGKSAYERIHEANPERLAAAKHLFESPFWDLLAQPARTNAEYSAAIADLVQERGWFRVEARQFQDLRCILGPEEPAVEQHVGAGYVAMVRFFVESQPDIDTLYLLSLLFREAHGALALDHAQVAKSALTAAVHFFWRCLPVDEERGRLFGKLVNDRIIYNSIIDEDSVSGRLATEMASSTSRIDKLKTFIRGYVAGEMSAGPQVERCPIVTYDSRLKWFDEKRAGLASFAREAAYAEVQATNLSDYRHPEAIRQAAEFKSSASELRAAIQPPARDAANYLPASPLHDSHTESSKVDALTYRIPPSFKDPW